jgi:hypothetical protein
MCSDLRTKKDEIGRNMYGAQYVTTRHNARASSPSHPGYLDKAVWYLTDIELPMLGSTLSDQVTAINQPIVLRIKSSGPISISTAHQESQERSSSLGIISDQFLRSMGSWLASAW